MRPIESQFETLIDSTNFEDFGCDDGISDGAKKIIDEGLNKNTVKKYDKFGNMYEKFCLDNDQEEKNGSSVINFMYDIGRRYAAGSLWSIFSCIGNYWLRKFNTRLANDRKIMRFMKALTKNWKKTQSKTFYAEQIKEIILHLSKSQSPKDRLFGIIIILSYHGLMRKSEVLDIKVEDVKKEKNFYEVFFNSVRKNDKTEMAEFKFNIPEYCNDFIDRYIAELDEKTIPCSRFLKNGSKNGKRKQNMGRNMLTYVPKRACEVLGMDHSGYTTHCWRRSAAMNMADRGISLLNLKRAGGWTSDAVAQQYIGSSKKVRVDNMRLLEPEPDVGGVGKEINGGAETIVQKFGSAKEETLVSTCDRKTTPIVEGRDGKADSGSVDKKEIPTKFDGGEEKIDPMNQMKKPEAMGEHARLVGTGMEGTCIKVLLDIILTFILVEALAAANPHHSRQGLVAQSVVYNFIFGSVEKKS